MAVNYEIKGQLAKLLATEDLVVEHKKVPTACFNMKTRVLTLPMWERASNVIYDMLVAHEVGHALYTPAEDWLKQEKVPPSYVNIVEDVRIEKLMKRRYAGLAKTMYSGYKDLSDQDFFQIADDDHNSYSLADRVNLHYKIGNFINVEFKEHERDVVDMISECETFADTLLAAEELYRISKDQDKLNSLDVKIELNSHSDASSADGGDDQQMVDVQQDPSDFDAKSNQASSQERSNSAEEDVPSKVSDLTQSQSESTSTQEKTNSPSNQPSDPTAVKTDKRLQEAIEKLVSYNGNENVYVEFPNLNMDTIINSNSDIYEVIDKHWNCEDVDVFESVDAKYQKFKTSAQREVNYLVKEFECRKSADSYARATTARTGVLDCTKLHTYKYNEDLFKKVTTLADGKNHGLIFILDWSGSMDRVLMDTIKQLYNLIWFCKKVSIPFEVYAFTYEWRCRSYNGNSPHQKAIEGTICLSEHFSLMNLFTSKVNNVQLESQMKKIFRIVNAVRCNFCSYSIPNQLQLSGTPLNESIIALNQIIPEFQQKNKLQKVHTIILTDGEASSLPYFTEVCGKYDHSYVGCRNFYTNSSFIRDRKTGHVYKNDPNLDHHTAYTDLLLRYLRNKYPNVSFIGMRILSSGESGSFIRKYFSANFESSVKLQEQWRKEKSVSIKTNGYHSYFGIASNSLSDDSDFIVSDNATKTEIRNALKKYVNGKKVNKKILNEFVGLIA